MKATVLVSSCLLSVKPCTAECHGCRRVSVRNAVLHPRNTLTDKTRHIDFFKKQNRLKMEAKHGRSHHPATGKRWVEDRGQADGFVFPKPGQLKRLHQRQEPCLKRLFLEAQPNFRHTRWEEQSPVGSLYHSSLHELQPTVFRIFIPQGVCSRSRTTAEMILCEH